MEDLSAAQLTTLINAIRDKISASEDLYPQLFSLIKETVEVNTKTHSAFIENKHMHEEEIVPLLALLQENSQNFGTILEGLQEDRQRVAEIHSVIANNDYGLCTTLKRLNTFVRALSIVTGILGLGATAAGIISFLLR